MGPLSPRFLPPEGSEVFRKSLFFLYSFSLSGDVTRNLLSPILLKKELQVNVLCAPSGTFPLTKKACTGKIIPYEKNRPVDIFTASPRSSSSRFFPG
jgi:hypothetical protein